MGLRAKFNLAFIAAFLVGFVAAGVILQQLFIDNAREQTLQNARIMISAANAIRTYTAHEIVPLTGFEKGGKFLPQSVPSYAAQTNFHEVAAQFADFTYKEATLNPTAPTDRASDWEADFINDFRAHASETELVGERNTATGRALTLAHPITIHDPACLSCHSTPAAAPASMIALYGTANGFGWNNNETVGAQIVSVPMSVPLAKAQHTFIVFMAILFAVFLVIIVILNVLLHYVVIQPVVRVSRIANAVSLGEPDVEEYEKKGNDEIASLSQSFNRMRRSLDSAMSMLQ